MEYGGSGGCSGWFALPAPAAQVSSSCMGRASLARDHRSKDQRILHRRYRQLCISLQYCWFFGAPCLLHRLAGLWCGQPALNFLRAHVHRRLDGRQNMQRLVQRVQLGQLFQATACAQPLRQQVSGASKQLPLIVPLTRNSAMMSRGSLSEGSVSCKAARGVSLWKRSSHSPPPRRRRRAPPLTRSAAWRLGAAVRSSVQRTLIRWAYLQVDAASRPGRSGLTHAALRCCRQPLQRLAHGSG